ncbi:MAG: hypothetical protein JWR60_3888, partial [Polaromonas sp.]|nr:hypothetical protein [Polaromonas sp.]
TRHNASPLPAAPAAGMPAGGSSPRTAWLLFGPPAFMVATRWLLQLAEDRQHAAPALPLAPVSTTAGTLELLWPVAVALALLIAAGWVVRRLGWRRVMPAVGAIWLLLWLAGSGALVQRHLNRQGLFLQEPAATETAPHARNQNQTQLAARVLASQFKAPSLRGTGGTELVLQVAGQDIPHRLLIEAARAAALKPGDTLALQVAPGRFSGLFVTGWRAAPSAVPHAQPIS